jgi:hypothetical protein
LYLSASEFLLKSQAVGRFIYFLNHPSQDGEIWTLDLAFATFTLSVATLCIVIIQLRVMRRQTILMERQTTILTAQEELSQMILARRINLSMYAVRSPSTVSVWYENIADKTAHGFFWHLAIPSQSAMHQVLDDSGSRVIESQGIMDRDGV